MESGSTIKICLADTIYIHRRVTARHASEFVLTHTNTHTCICICILCAFAFNLIPSGSRKKYCYIIFLFYQFGICRPYGFWQQNKFFILIGL